MEQVKEDVMELRDTIALEAMKVLIEDAYFVPVPSATAVALPGKIASAAYTYADEMLKARGVDLRTMEDK